MKGHSHHQTIQARRRREALSAIGVQGITVTEFKGFGRQKGHTELYRGAEYVVDFLPKVRSKRRVRRPGRARHRGDRGRRPTGKIGDGKVFVYDLEQVVAFARRNGPRSPLINEQNTEMKKLLVSLALG